MSGICDGVDLFLSLDQELFLGKRLGNCGPYAAQTGAAKEVVVGVDGSLLGNSVDGGGRLGSRVDSSNRTNNKVDRRVVKCRDIGKLDPSLFGIVLVGQRKRRTDQVVYSGLAQYNYHNSNVRNAQ